MLGRKKDNQFTKGGHTLFDHALEIKGDVQFSGVLDIEGIVHGNIIAAEGAEALVRVREKGCVCGDIRSPKVIINGRVNGDVYAEKHLELAAKAEVNGNVHYKVIEMVKGSQVNGNLMHIEDSVSEVVAKVKVLPSEGSMKSAADTPVKTVNT